MTEREKEKLLPCGRVRNKTLADKIECQTIQIQILFIAPDHVDRFST
jgi:hypothetical protein